MEVQGEAVGDLCIQESSDLQTWEESVVMTNVPGSSIWQQPALEAQRFFRVRIDEVDGGFSFPAGRLTHISSSITESKAVYLARGSDWAFPQNPNFCDRSYRSRGREGGKGLQGAPVIRLKTTDPPTVGRCGRF